VNKFQAETVKRMQDARLRCEAIGDQPLSINWIKDKLPFNPREDPRFELIENFTNQGLSAELIIHGTDRRDSALYTCIASNSYGDDDCNIQLIMQGNASSSDFKNANDEIKQKL
jgi:Down syndrome cell adhesion protein